MNGDYAQPNAGYATYHDPYDRRYQYQDSSTTLNYGTEYNYPPNGTIYTTSAPTAGTGYYTQASRPASIIAKEKAYNELRDDDDIRDTRITRYCCGCFKSRLACLSCCGLFTILLLTGLGLAAFFLWPREPRVIVSNPYFPTTADGFKLPANSSWVPGPQISTEAIMIGLGVNISVFSDNYVTFNVKSLSIQGQLRDVKGEVIDARKTPNKLSTTSVVNDIDFAGKRNTTVQLPIAIEYKFNEVPNVGQILSDPVVAVLANACGVPGVQEKTPGARIRMKVTAVIDLKIIAWTGYKPKVDQEVAFDCPRTITDALSGLFGQGAQDIIDAAKTIAGEVLGDAANIPGAEDIADAAGQVLGDANIGNAAGRLLADRPAELNEISRLLGE
ncbi:hypothetical protein BC832DRAFT_537511 [Gaertneriomyces semiglobifer]|nr:hypothetical protein BC832DRAFT_537511 [Gaertneriomyces semiglobifer]